MALELFIPGTPKAQPRTRAMSLNGRVRVYDPGTAEGWKSQIAQGLQPYLTGHPLDCPVSIDAVFLMPRPKRLMRKKDSADRIPFTAKPDRDNLDKALLDTLVQIGFLRDDSLVYTGTISKYYCGRDEIPGLWLKITA